ncbi:hypothetical protein ACMD2_25539 [Ananas comosus]|uniref:Endonuclease/exonuclease/phosphatase domain-containing protein n=1 Tax=Ananas comosus TaxID=4615 RepID=A0A199UXX5_ANACO|nr:hypothetical protein ACMD2_25539 [Ananas comosus]
MLRNVVVCLQESKTNVFVESNNASGGLITCWSLCIFICHEVIVRRYSITILLSLIKDVTRFYITNVYGSTNLEGKEDLFLELAQLKECYKGKWIMCGDFNNTRFQEELKGKTRSSRATVMSYELIKESALIDLPMSNQSFTLSNIQRNSTLARLDRFLISTEWDQEFPLTKVEGLPRALGPHGFSLSFYHTFWDTLKGKISNLFQELFEGSLSTSPIAYAFYLFNPEEGKG